MPKVPISQRQVRERVFNAPTISSGSVQARQIQGFSEVASQIGGLRDDIQKQALVARKESEKAEIDSFKNDLVNFKNKNLHDPEKGYTLRQGKDALDAFDDTEKSFDEYVEERKKLLKNPNVLTKAESIAGSIRNQHSLSMMQHSNRENEVYKDETFKTTLKTFRDDALLNSSNLGVLNENIAKIRTEIDVYGKRKGMDAKSIEQLKVNEQSKVHMGLIERYLNNGDDLTAKTYLEKFHKDMDSESIMKAEKLLHTANTLGESQRLVDEAFKLEGKNYEESLAYIREKGDKVSPEVRKMAVQEYKSRFKEETAMRDYEENQYFQHLGDVMMKDPAKFELKPSDMDRLSFSQQRQLLAAKSQAIRDKAGVKDESDMKEYDRLMSLPSHELQKEKIFLNGKLSYSHKQKFIELQRDEKKHKEVQALNSYISNSVIDLDEEGSTGFREQFSEALNKYPKDQQGKMSTWKEISKDLHMEMSRAWYKTDIPNWKARAEGLDLQPDVDKPKGVLPEATYINKMVGGRRAMWQEGNGGEGTRYYDSEGNYLGKLTKKK